LARAPNSQAEQAKTLYLSGKKLIEIAENFGVSAGTVRSWKNRYKWDGEPNATLQNGKRNAAKKRGGQQGNKNAAGNRGGSAPENNKNAVKTGEFEALFFDALGEDEKQLISMIQLDKKQLLLQEIQLLTVRERRMLKRIEDIKRTADDQKNDDTLGMTAVKYKSGTEEHTMEYQGALGQIQAVEDALTRVQARKQKAIDSLHRYGFDDARLELEIMKVELETLKRDPSDQEIEDDGFMAAMNEGAAEIWGDADD
jgi:uncharacterized protein YjcR